MIDLSNGTKNKILQLTKSRVMALKSEREIAGDQVKSYGIKKQTRDCR